MRTAVGIAILVLFAAAGPASGEDVIVLENAIIEYRPELTGLEAKEGYVVRRHGQLVERTLELPAALPQRRIVATVRVRPVMGTDNDGRRRPQPAGLARERGPVSG